MDLFAISTVKPDPARVRQLKDWVYQLLPLKDEVAISIQQLQCTEPGCPPIETVIAILTTPIQQYKIHKPLNEVDYADVLDLFQARGE
jgi:hypothetical protein